MNLTSEQPAAFSALVEILDLFFMTQAYIQFEEKKNKEKQKMTKKALFHCCLYSDLSRLYSVSLWWIFL